LLAVPMVLRAQDGHTQDSLALVSIYHYVQLYRSDNWLTSHPISTWYGVTVDNNGRVVKLSFYQNLHFGRLSPALGNLSQLKELDMRGDNSTEVLVDSIPSSLGNLQELESLNLAYNKLTGPIPASLGNLAKLTEMHLEYNLLGGAIPSSLGNLIKLQTLNLSQNQMTGHIPAELGNLAEAVTINLTSSGLGSGPIPPSLGNLSKLQYLYLDGNALIGTIPAELGNLSNLLAFGARHNYLTGQIPEGLASLPLLDGIDLSFNQLSGSLPAGLGMHKLNTLNLGFNQLSGPISDEIVNHVYTSLVIQGNMFTLEKIEGLIKKYKVGLMPQNGIPLHRSGNQLSITADGTLTACTFLWYKNGVYYTSKKADSTLVITEPGSYETHVRDSLIIKYIGDYQGAYLYSAPFSVDALPLRLLSFTGTLAKASVALQWQTTNEDNTSAFEVQRVMPLTPPEALGTIEAANTQGAHLYKFIDNAPLPGTNYYRLKMIDKDGQVNYSNIISVKTTDDAVSLQLLPNPVQNSVSLSFTAPAGAYCIDIADAEGRRLKQICGVAANGVNRLAIDVHSYAQGTYFIMVTDKDGRKQSVQMIKGR